MNNGKRLNVIKSFIVIIYKVCKFCAVVVDQINIEYIWLMFGTRLTAQKETRKTEKPRTN